MREHQVVFMPRALPDTPTQFVFSPALYPQTPLKEKPVFMHGEIKEVKRRNGEVILRCADEKGEWEAYLEFSFQFNLEIGQKVRGFGIIENQPDGKVVLAARWVKKTDENELAFCVHETQKNWETVCRAHPGVGELKPYVQPISKPMPIPAFTGATQAPESNEFVPASELKIERDFV